LGCPIIRQSVACPSAVGIPLKFHRGIHRCSTEEGGNLHETKLALERNVILQLIVPLGNAISGLPGPLGSHASALPQLQYEGRLDRRRDDQEWEHDGEILPKGMPYIGPEEGAFLASDSPDNRYAGAKVQRGTM